MNTTPDSYNVGAEELRQIVEQIENLELEKGDIAAQIKDQYESAKGRGYDTAVLKLVIKLRKQKPDQVAEQEAILDMYKSALGMS
jgi:uncharacterized protein (UPF0335 family)